MNLVYEALMKRKIRYIVRHILMKGDGPRGLSLPVKRSASDEKSKTILQDFQPWNEPDYGKYLVELGYLNVFLKTNKDRKRLCDWYLRQVKHAKRYGRYQLAYILAARSEYLLTKYGKYDQMEIMIFDIITDKNNPIMAEEIIISYYNAIAAYAKLVADIIGAWFIACMPIGGGLTGRAGVTEWLDAEQKFMDTGLSGPVFVTIPDTENYQQARDRSNRYYKLMIESIEQARDLLTQGTGTKQAGDGNSNA